MSLTVQYAHSFAEIGFPTMTGPAIHAVTDGNPPFWEARAKRASRLALTILFLTSAVAVAQDRPADFDQVVASASTARDHGDISHAIDLYEEAVQLNPKWPDGWWYLGSLQYGSNSYGPASDALTHYLELTPGAGPALALRGLCEFEEEKYSASLQDLQQAISRGAANQPKNAGIILYHESLLLTKAGRFEEALGQYTLMVKHGTFNDDVVNGIGLASLRMPILPKEIEPSQAQIISTVGRAASNVMSGDLPRAQTAFLEMFKNFPKTPNIHYLYGYLLFTVDPDQAMAQFNEELVISPESAITHGMLAWAYGLRGDYTDSLPYARKAAEEDPSLPMGQLVLGRALVETGDVIGGLPHLEAVLASDPQNLEAHLSLAKAYSKLGRSDDARRERLQCLSISGQGTATDETI